MSLNVKMFKTPLWCLVAGIGLAAAGCTDEESHSRLDDIPLPCTPEVTSYRLSHVDPSAAQAQSIDLDGDHHGDDGLGHAHDLLTTFVPEFSVSERFDRYLKNNLVWAITTATCGNDIRVSVDTIPDVKPSDYEGPRSAGFVTGGVIDVRDGTGRIPLGSLATATEDSADPGWTVGDALTMRATITGDTIEGVFAMALPNATVRAELAAPIARLLTAQRADNSLRIATDNDHDGTVTAAEVAATTTYQGITSSDITLQVDGQPQTSIAFRFVGKRI